MHLKFTQTQMLQVPKFMIVNKHLVGPNDVSWMETLLKIIGFTPLLIQQIKCCIIQDGSATVEYNTIGGSTGQAMAQ